MYSKECKAYLGKVLPDEEHKEGKDGHEGKENVAVGEDALLNETHHRVGQADGSQDVNYARPYRLQISSLVTQIANYGGSLGEHVVYLTMKAMQTLTLVGKVLARTRHGDVRVHQAGTVVGGEASMEQFFALLLFAFSKHSSLLDRPLGAHNLTVLLSVWDWMLVLLFTFCTGLTSTGRA